MSIGRDSRHAALFDYAVLDERSASSYFLRHTGQYKRAEGIAKEGIQQWNFVELALQHKYCESQYAD
ncbi:hypothetical protein VPNG_00370 [Cytospora leucostoma]|uniref:Uncharacterized protein n=1 Tax=Cytospora leucostoma TaxID=1230097 RepID=A0A423XN15_9PEZI|nr:hypothetical protein VPNG_00370 [Cytospora leucostoma]